MNSGPVTCCPMFENGVKYDQWANGDRNWKIKGCSWNDDEGSFENQPYEMLYSGDCITE